MISLTQLQAVLRQAPDERCAFWLPYLNAAMAEFNIDKPARVAMFIAQIAHESGELAHVIENLNYSAAGLLKTWPNRFDTTTAATYARHPTAIANKVYADRLGNGNEASGDGWRYRGRGLMQITGRQRYARTGVALGLPLEESPELLEHPDAASRSAGYYWRSRGLNALADVGDIRGVTFAINGGFNGLAERTVYWLRAKSVLGVGTVLSATTPTRPPSTQ